MATIRRRRTLDMVPEVVCPAAVPIAGTVPHRAGVICDVLRQEQAREDGIGISPGMLAASRDAEGGTLLTAESDPTTICCGDAVPVLNELSVGGGRSSYTYCPVWQAEKKRIADGRHALAGGGVQPDAVSSPEFDAANPGWGSSMAALDELAGE
jgi:hypothetical protein